MSEQWTIEQVTEFLGAATIKSASKTLSRWGIKRVGTEDRAGGRVASLFDADQVRAGKNRPRGKGGRPSNAQRLTREARTTAARPAPDPDTGVEQWLAAHRQDLLRVGDLLIDHRGQLLTLLADPAQRQQLAEAIDTAGELLTSQPRVGYVGAVSYAMFLLRPDGPAGRVVDPVLREGIELGTRLRHDFNQAHGA